LVRRERLSSPLTPSKDIDTPLRALANVSEHLERSGRVMAGSAATSGTAPRQDAGRQYGAADCHSPSLRRI